MTDKHTPGDDFTRLFFGYEDDGPNCLIGSHGMFFARVQQTPQHNALEYARKFAAVDALLAACKEAAEAHADHGSTDDGTATGKELDFALGRLKSAIALAEGRR